RRFYLRRSLRIFPPYYAFLAAMGLAAALQWLECHPGHFLHALTYTANYSFITQRTAYLDYPLGHTWSLSVEEQFYLLWPAALLGVTAANVAIALGIDWWVRFADGRIGRVLNSAPMVFVGVISYSIYLWQQPFVANYASSAAASRFPVNLVLVCVAALTSYYV